MVGDALGRVETLASGVTVEEFDAWTGGQPGGKYQLVHGEIRAMSPASATHGTIQSHLGRIIGQHLLDTRPGCRSVTEPSVRVRVNHAYNRRVPDLGVTCAPDVAGQVDLPEPVVLVEILSAGNQAETWENVWAYPTIPSLKHILVVSSFDVEAQMITRDAGGAWPEMPETIATHETVDLTAIDLSFPLRGLYLNTYLLR